MDSTQILERVENIVYIHQEPINDVEYFSLLCIEALNVADKDDIYIVVDPSIGSISSAYMGAMVSVYVLSVQMDKKFVIQCSPSLRKWFEIIGGDKLLSFMNISGSAGKEDRSV